MKIIKQNKAKQKTSYILLTYTLPVIACRLYRASTGHVHFVAWTLVLCKMMINLCTHFQNFLHVLHTNDHESYHIAHWWHSSSLYRFLHQNTQWHRPLGWSRCDCHCYKRQIYRMSQMVQGIQLHGMVQIHQSGHKSQST